jgi:chemotaxis signal transduction protein
LEYVVFRLGIDQIGVEAMQSTFETAAKRTYRQIPGSPNHVLGYTIVGRAEVFVQDLRVRFGYQAVMTKGTPLLLLTASPAGKMRGYIVDEVLEFAHLRCVTEQPSSMVPCSRPLFEEGALYHTGSLCGGRPIGFWRMTLDQLASPADL